MIESGWFLRLSQSIVSCLPKTGKETETRKLLTDIYERYNKLAIDFNKINTRGEAFEIRVISTVAQDNSPFCLNDSQAPHRLYQYGRVIVTTALWALSVRGRSGIVDIFSLPASEAAQLPQSETASRLKVRFELTNRLNGPVWTLSDLPIDENELGVILLGLLRDLVAHSKHELNPDGKIIDVSLKLTGTTSIVEPIRMLLKEKHHLIQRVVSQQEEIQNRIARDIHDAVINDIMSVKRLFADSDKFSKNEIVLMLDDIVLQLREICQDLTPRYLKDWGLKPVLKDLVMRLAERTAAKCVFNCSCQIPRLPHDVEVHIFRIIQEIFNNIEKHAEATEVFLDVQLDDHLLTLTVKDNGKGFVLKDIQNVSPSLDGSGSGSSIIRERTELISELTQAYVEIQSDPGFGTVVSLKVSLAD